MRALFFKFYSVKLCVCVYFFYIELKGFAHALFRALSCDNLVYFPGLKGNKPRFRLTKLISCASSSCTLFARV